ncbi:hypothetical protein [Anaerotignum sp.]|uniref:hypothetical protein n=1 Tax=Anaerotignum sp. TaxID=2039241 RepID=UPI003321ED03
MLEIIKEEIIGEYKVITYSNGMVVKKSVNSIDIQSEPTPEPLSPKEQTLMQMAINMEYITTMMELKQ